MDDRYAKIYPVDDPVDTPSFNPGLCKTYLDLLFILKYQHYIASVWYTLIDSVSVTLHNALFNYTCR